MNSRSTMRLAVLLGLALAVIASRWPYPGFPAPILIAACFLLGWLNADRPWRWPLILVTFLLLEDLYRLSLLPAMVGMWIAKVPYHELLPKPSSYPPNPIDNLVAIIPGLAATYLGVWARQSAKSAGQSLREAANDPKIIR